tara:strand:- start:306 stop:1256 length:951 start_codon:yes stop_codon:yes gene_type:complete
MVGEALRRLGNAMPSMGGSEVVPPEGATLLEPREDDISGILLEAAKQGALGSSLAQTAVNAPRLVPLRAEEQAATGLADAWRKGIRSGTLLPSEAAPSPYDYGPPSPEFLEKAAYRKRIDHLFPGTPDPATGFNRYYAGRMPYAGASMPHSPVQIWPESTATPRWGDSLVGGHQTYPESGPTQDTTIRKVLWDETIGEGRRGRGLEKGKALLEKARAVMAQEGAAKAAMKAGAKGLARGAVVGAAQGAAVAPAAAYLGHEASRPRSGGYFTPPEGIRERYQDILSTDEANLISEAIERRKMRERALLEADAIGMAD